MARNRTIYNVLGLFVSPSPATGFMFSSGTSGVNFVTQLQRVQTTNDSWSVTRTDIVQFGQLAAISREIIEAPTANLDGSWLVADISNERKVGLYTSGDASVLKDILEKTQDEKNYFLAVAPEGVNIFDYTGQSQVVQVTNGFLASYSTEGAVGGLPTSNITVEGLNWAVSTGSHDQVLQVVNPVDGQVIAGRTYTIPVGTSGLSNTVAAIRPDGIQVDIGSAALGLNISDLKIQSYNISFDLTRENLQKLGSRFAFAKEPTFPVTVSASITADLGELEEASLADILCNDTPYNIRIALYDPVCTGQGALAAAYELRGMKIDSEEFTHDIGSNGSVTINYSATIGAASEVDVGLFMSGRNY